MAEAFSFSRDRSRIMWKDTFKHNGLRALGAGIAWAIITTIVGNFEGNPLLLPIAMPLGYFVFILPFGLVMSWLSSFIPWVGLMAWFIGFFVAVGDPLVFFLNKARPDIVPVERPSFFSPRVITFVLSPFER